ncbi:hypothetical protein D3C79_1007910 [compost metagenome]
MTSPYYNTPVPSKQFKSDGAIVNPADGINADGSLNVRVLEGSGGGSSTKTYTRLAAEAKPTTDVNDGDSLLIVDTGDVYVYYSGQWRLI